MMRRLRALVLSSALAAACGKAPPRPPPAPRVDAAPRVDTAPAPADAAAPVDAPPVDAAVDGGPDAGPPPSIHVSTVGVERLRPGAVIPIQVWQRGPSPTNVTARATFRVEPPSRGTMLPGGRFRGRELGRTDIIARVGDEEARGIVEVSETLPPGMAVTPVIRGGPGQPVVMVRYGVRGQGRVVLEVEWVNGSLHFEGAGRGLAFPVTVPATNATFDLHQGPYRPPPVTGRIVFERWTAGRLDGRAELAVGETPLRFTFSLHDPDPWSLLIPPTERTPVAPPSPPPTP